jgi:DHA1 family bicyclomycin/chloramphenicol resistance-like MFS transporter
MTVASIATAEAPPSSASMKARAIGVPLVLFGMYAAFGASWMAVVPLFPELEAALGVKRADAAWLVTIVSLAKSFVPILAGVAAARFGLTRTLRGAAACIAISVVIPFLPGGLPAWVAARFVFGVGGAVWLTLMGAVVVDVVAPARRGFVNALNGVAVNTGAIIGLKSALPLKEAFGYQAALSILSLATALFLVVLVAMGPMSKAAPRVVSFSALLQSYKAVLAEKTTWFIAGAFCGPLALYLVVNTWLPSYLEAVYALSRKDATTALSTMNLWGIPASLMVGFMLQKNVWKVRGWIVVGAIMLPLGMVGALLADASLRPVFFAFAGAGLFIPVAPLVTLLQRQPDMSAARFGMVMGTMGSVTYIVSSVAPNVVGSAVAAGVPIADALLPCCALGITPLLGLFLKEPTA